MDVGPSSRSLGYDFILFLFGIAFGGVLSWYATYLNFRVEAVEGRKKPLTLVRIPCEELKNLCSKNSDFELPEMVMGKYEVCRKFDQPKED